nr:translation initiation factor IF-2-like [Pan troglodytes]
MPLAAPPRPGPPPRFRRRRRRCRGVRGRRAVLRAAAAAAAAVAAASGCQQPASKANAQTVLGSFAARLAGGAACTRAARSPAPPMASPTPVRGLAPWTRSQGTPGSEGLQPLDTAHTPPAPYPSWARPLPGPGACTAIGGQERLKSRFCHCSKHLTDDV